MALESLPEHLDEPIGLVAPAKTPRLGLEKGDVVRTINGSSPAGLPSPDMVGSAQAVFLDVLRRGKPVVIRLQVKLENVVTTIRRDQFADDIDRDQGRDRALAQVTKDGKPSGLWLRKDWFWFTPLKAGDVIRKVDGVAVNTIQALFGALGRAKDHPKLEIDVDRVGQAITVTAVLEDPPDDTTYELPRSLIEAALQDTMSAVQGVRVLPNMTNGTPIGYKLYAIRSESRTFPVGEPAEHAPREVMAWFTYIVQVDLETSRVHQGGCRLMELANMASPAVTSICSPALLLHASQPSIVAWHHRCTHRLTMKASLASCLAMQLVLGVGGMVGADSVTGPDKVAAVEMLVGKSHGQDQPARIQQDIELAGFLLTAEEWQSLEPDARAQLLAAASLC